MGNKKELRSVELLELERNIKKDIEKEKFWGDLGNQDGHADMILVSDMLDILYKRFNFKQKNEIR